MEKAWKQFLEISIWVALVLFVMRSLISWNEVTQIVGNGEFVNGLYCIIGYGGEAIAISAIFMLAFNKWLWKYKFFNIITGKMPILAERYEGILISDYDHLRREAKLTVEQTFLSIKIKMVTDESVSSDITATIEDIHNEPQLVYVYINEPRADVQERSEIHYGTVMLKVSDSKHIFGNYYTGRNTRGSLDFKAL